MSDVRIWTLRLHVPISYILRAQSSYIGTPVRLKYLLYRYMEPLGELPVPQVWTLNSGLSRGTKHNSCKSINDNSRLNDSDKQ